MLNSQDRINILNRAFVLIKPFYHYILIDLPPTSGLLQRFNGLCAADDVVVPLDSSIYALETLERPQEILP